MDISFVVPAYNEEARLGKCLEAIRRELARTHSIGLRVNAEIVVVDNGSSDRTGEIACSFAGVRVVHEPRKGLVRARDAGFQATTGALVANIDSDTILTEGWLQRTLSEFRGSPQLVALSGPYIYYDLSAVTRAGVKVFYFFGWLVYLANHYVLGIGAMLQGGNFVVRRDALIKVGGFDTSIDFYGEDTDVARRISRAGRVKWTFALPAYTSGRRLAKEGIIRMAVKYALNFFWMTFTGKPYTKSYVDIR